MFSPRPPSIQWYYVLDGKLDGNTDVELWANGFMFTLEANKGVDWSRPDLVKSIGSHRWYKFYESAVNPGGYYLFFTISTT